MKFIKSLLLLCMMGVVAVAQKLPNKQSTTVLAPAHVKIDGNIAEWGSLQAYNHATDIAYTIANDDKNLYFIVRAENQAVVNRIINGGITLAVNKAGKQNKSDITIVYPVFEKGEKPVISINKALLEAGGNGAAVSDITVNQTNSSFSIKSKLIMVTGIAGIDTLLSVYNESGIKVSARFDNHLAYSCELSIPLDKLQLSGDRFTYHVVLNGESPLGKKGGLGSIISSPNEIVDAKLAAEQTELGKATAPTDFWGEYTLKRP